MWLRRPTRHSYLEALRSSPKCSWLLSSSSSYAYSSTPHKKPKLAPLQERKMVDRFRLCAKGGDGGNGCFSFRRSRHDRRGKPDGGNGGRGGDVILECSPLIWDFRNLQHHMNGKRGGNGLSKDKIGTRGTEKVVHVPVGTVIHLVEGEVPTVIEEHSVKTLDPWELPGTLEVDHPSDSDHKASISTPGQKDVLEGKKFDSLSNGEKKIEKPAGMRKAMRGSLAGCDFQPGPQCEELTFCTEEGVNEDDSVEAESGMFEDEEDNNEELDEDEDEDEEDNKEEIQFNVAELTEPGQKLRIARGGEGGLGNVSLGKHSMVNKSKKVGSGKGTTSNINTSDDEDESLTAGFPGTEAVLVLELKSIADVGLVGMPNAGKSTLLGAISRAKPTVGHYAFTTLRPNIGNLNYDDFFSVTVADIPGLIKGAHVNRGLGHAFLRHIERTKVLAYVVDLGAALDGRKGIPPWEQLRDLVLELESHQTGLADRPSLIVANKIDEVGAEDVYEKLKRRVPGVPIFPVCAVLEEGVSELKAGLRRLMDGSESPRLELDRIMVEEEYS